MGSTGLMNLALPMPHGWEWLIILAIGLLLFGKRLPEVGRSLGKGIVEFKRGIKGIEEEIEGESSKSGGAKGAAKTPLTDGSDRRVSQGVSQGVSPGVAAEQAGTPRPE